MRNVGENGHRLFLQRGVLLHESVFTSLSIDNLSNNFRAELLSINPFNLLPWLFNCFLNGRVGGKECIVEMAAKQHKDDTT